MQATELIGRSQDVEQVSSALFQPECRLLTLLGSAGVGKTRLALAVAQSMTDTFADGVCFVDLTQIDDPAEVLPLTAMQIDILMVDQDTRERLKEILFGKQILLVLDNFEHVLSGARTVAEAMRRGIL